MNISFVDIIGIVGPILVIIGLCVTKAVNDHTRKVYRKKVAVTAMKSYTQSVYDDFRSTGERIPLMALQKGISRMRDMLRDVTNSNGTQLPDTSVRIGKLDVEFFFRVSGHEQSVTFPIDHFILPDCVVTPRG